MDSGQRSTGDEYIVEQVFYDKMEALGMSIIKAVFTQFSSIIDLLPEDPEEYSVVSGVIHRRDGVFFYALEYFKSDGLIVLVDINEIESDDYLDAILSGATIEQAQRNGELA
jgi:hypothetical protein